MTLDQDKRHMNLWGRFLPKTSDSRTQYMVHIPIPWPFLKTLHDCPSSLSKGLVMQVICLLNSLLVKASIQELDTFVVEYIRLKL